MTRISATGASAVGAVRSGPTFKLLPLATEVPPERRLLTAAETRYVLAGFRELLAVGGDVEPHLRGVLADTLAHPGGLLRAQIAYGVLRGHGVARRPARALAVAIEYFHTASLLFDDLPAMDDATDRRGRTCPHRVYGEAATMLGALALINRAYELLWQVLGPLTARRRQRASRLVADCLGAGGILNGQAHDLHFTGGEAATHQVAEGKTVSLVRLTLVLPALVAGVGDATAARLDRLATVWGLGYQALDDLKDCLLSRAEAGKTTHRDRLLGRPNLAHEIGAPAAGERLASLFAEGRAIVGELAAGNRRWRSLVRLQEVLDEEQRRLAQRTPSTAVACA